MKHHDRGLENSNATTEIKFFNNNQDTMTVQNEEVEKLKAENAKLNIRCDQIEKEYNELKSRMIKMEDKPY